MEYFEPTLEEVRRMQAGDPELVSRFLPYMLMMTEIEIGGRAQRDAVLARWEAFKQRVKEGKLTQKFYPLADRANLEECRSLGFDKAKPFLTNVHMYARNIKAVFTGEKRFPRKGEWYISGSTPEAYRAPNDLAVEYQICRLVRTETKEIEVVVQE